jgi:hypothetical protein
MGPMTELHAAIGTIALAASAAFAVLAFGAAAAARLPAWLDWIRAGLAGLLVVGAAIGLAMAFGGRTPAEAIHWFYGGVIVALPVAAASLHPRMPARTRSAAYGAAGVGMALMAWRLASSG